MRSQRLVCLVAAVLQLTSITASAEGTFFKNRKPAEAPAPQPAPQPVPQPVPAPQPEPQPTPTPTPAPANVSGAIDQVLTTDTFVVAGQQLQLYGVAGEPSPYVEALSQWLAANGNQMNCKPEGGRYRCFTPGGVDIGGVVIFNGAGKASADAPPEYQNAEQQARAGMKGVWQQ